MADSIRQRLEELTRDETLEPEQRVLLRAALNGDQDAIDALQNESSRIAPGLLRALREARRRPGRPHLRLIPGGA